MRGIRKTCDDLMQANQNLLIDELIKINVKDFESVNTILKDILHKQIKTMEEFEKTGRGEPKMWDVLKQQVQNIFDKKAVEQADFLKYYDTGVFIEMLDKLSDKTILENLIRKAMEEAEKVRTTPKKAMDDMNTKLGVTKKQIYGYGVER